MGSSPVLFALFVLHVTNGIVTNDVSNVLSMDETPPLDVSFVETVPIPKDLYNNLVILQGGPKNDKVGEMFDILFKDVDSTGSNVPTEVSDTAAGKAIRRWKAAKAADFLSTLKTDALQAAYKKVDAMFPLKIGVKEWFKFITGQTEADFRKNLDATTFTVEGDIMFINGPPVKDEKVEGKRKKARAGHWSVEVIGDLLNSAVSVPIPKVDSHNFVPDVHVPFRIITRELGAQTNKFVDVRYLQSRKENRGAVFQVASNFNGLETLSEDTLPSTKDFVTGWWADPTQGPAASVSAGAAAIAREYAAFYDGTPKNYKKWDQTGKRQVNFLSDPAVAKYFPVVNGYVVFSGVSLLSKIKGIFTTAANFTHDYPVSTMPTSPYGGLVQKVKIGIHRDARVYFSRQADYKLDITADAKQLINQVFTAGVNMAQGSNGAANAQLADGQDRANFILDAAYTGTYLAAGELARNYPTEKDAKKELFLTLIGGSAFGNKLSSIIDTIVRTHNDYGIERYGLSRVTISFYNYEDKPNLLTINGQDINAVKYLKQVLEAAKIPYTHDHYTLLSAKKDQPDNTQIPAELGPAQYP